MPEETADKISPHTLKSAIISPCGLHRYMLTRTWDIRKLSLLFVMLNPSKADAQIDDPTIRRCMGFAGLLGFGGIIVINLFSLRTTYPKELISTPKYLRNGSAWKCHCQQAIDTVQTIIAAWGACAIAKESPVLDILASHPTKLKCFGLTKYGSPRHPLYLKRDSPLQEFIL